MRQPGGGQRFPAPFPPAQTPTPFPHNSVNDSRAPSVMPAAPPEGEGPQKDPMPHAADVWSAKPQLRPEPQPSVQPTQAPLPVPKRPATQGEDAAAAAAAGPSAAKRRRREEHERAVEAAQAEKRRRREENARRQEEVERLSRERQQRKREAAAKQHEEARVGREAKEQRRQEDRERQLAKREREQREVVVRVDTPALLAAVRAAWAAAGAAIESVSAEALFGSITLRYKTVEAAQKAVEAGSLPFATPESLRFPVARQPVRMHCWYFDGDLPPELGTDVGTLAGHLQPMLENHFGRVRAFSRHKGHLLIEFESLEAASKPKEHMTPLSVGPHLLPRLCPGLPKQLRKGALADHPAGGAAGSGDATGGSAALADGLGPEAVPGRGLPDDSSRPGGGAGIAVAAAEGSPPDGQEGELASEVASLLPRGPAEGASGDSMRSDGHSHEEGGERGGLPGDELASVTEDAASACVFPGLGGATAASLEMAGCARAGELFSDVPARLPPGTAVVPVPPRPSGAPGGAVAQSRAETDAAS